MALCFFCCCVSVWAENCSRTSTGILFLKIKQASFQQDLNKQTEVKLLVVRMYLESMSYCLYIISCNCRGVVQ